MPRILWMEYFKAPNELRGKIDRELKKEPPIHRRELRLGRERKFRFEARKHAKHCIEDLAFIASHMRNVSATPEKEFARIFTDDTKDAFSLIGKARLDGLFGTPSIGDGQALELYGALNVARIESDLLRLQRDPEYREEIHLKLLGTPDYSFLRSVRLELEIIRSDREVGKLTIPGPARSDDRLERALGHLAPKDGV